MKMRELKKISANLAITLVYAEQLAGILQHREPEIILPHFYSTVKSGMEEYYQCLDLEENFQEFYQENEEALCCAFSDGPDDCDFHDESLTIQDYLEDLEEGIEVLEKLSRMIHELTCSSN